jgi:tetratricopeptide (TPR) repeat protein
MKPKKRVIPPQKQQKFAVKPSFKPNVWYAVISALTGFAFYANTIMHEYVLDDAGAINEFVKEGFSGIPKIMTTGMWYFDNVNLGYYRPLSMITFAIENEFFPENPHVSHLGNVVLYSLTGFFLCLLLMNLFNHIHPIFSLIVSILFLAHPVHTEVVANIKSRDEILAFLNLIIAVFILLHAYELKQPNWKSVIFSFIFFYLALLSKETAMTGLIIAPVVLFFANNYSMGKSLLRALPFLVAIIVFQYHKYAVLGTVTGTPPKDIVNYPYEEADAKFSSMFLIFLHCIRLILFPHPLTYDYSYNEIPAARFDSPLVLIGIVIALVLAFFSFKRLLRKSTLAFGVLFFCLTLAPAMAFVLLRGGILAERFLYAPSLGFCIAITFLIFKLSGINVHSPVLNVGHVLKNAKFILPVSIIFILYSFKTITRNPVWKDNLTLFSTDVNTSVNSCQVRRHYGSELINMGMYLKDPKKRAQVEKAKEIIRKNNPTLSDSIDWFDLGVEQLKMALRINPHFGDAFFKLGVAYQTLKVNNDSAIYYYTRAIQEAPGYAISYNNLAILYEGLGKHELASYYYNKAVEVNPRFSEGVRNRDAHRQKTGLDVRIYPTSTNLDSLIRSTPEEKRDFNFYYRLGTDYASKGDYVNAAKSLEKAVQLNPNFIAAMNNLANCYGMLKEYGKNIEMLNKILAISPNDVQALGNLAVTYELLGKKDIANEYRKKVRELTTK